MTVHQCSRCELRFATTAELADHLDHDHRMTVEALRVLSYPEARQAEPLYRQLVEQPDEVHRVLLVANQTLGGDELFATVAALRGAVPVAVYVLVPATPSMLLVQSWDGSVVRTEGGVLTGTTLQQTADDAGLAQARWRLRQAIVTLRERGIAAHGSVGDPNPLDAVARVLEREHFDEIVVSTLPRQMSRWLESDLPAQLERRFGLPVRTVVAG